MTPEQLKNQHEGVAFRALGLIIGLHQNGGIPEYAMEQAEELIAQDKRIEALRCEALAIEEHEAAKRDDLAEQRREMEAARLADEVAG